MNLPAGDHQLVQIMDAALAEARHRSGQHLICRVGCVECCHGPFRINALDVARLQSGLHALSQTDPARVSQIQLRARAWVREYAAVFPGDPETGVLTESEDEVERFEDFADQAPCPALDPATGRCEIYAWRPMTCRVFGPPVRVETGALACCQLCFTEADDSQIAACEMAVPHQLEDELVAGMDDRRETVVAYALLELPPQAG